MYLNFFDDALSDLKNDLQKEEVFSFPNDLVFNLKTKNRRIRIATINSISYYPTQKIVPLNLACKDISMVLCLLISDSCLTIDKTFSQLCT